MAEDVAEDRLLGGTVRLLQRRAGHRAGTDAVLLARLAGPRPGDRVVDLGAGSGAVALMIAALEPSVTLVMVERDPGLVDLCRRNIALNGVGSRGRAVEADILADGWDGASLQADLVVTNPPFFEEGEPASPDRQRREAHAMPAGGGLAPWIKAAASCLRPGGRLCLIHRADALPLCLDALRPRFGSLAIRPIQPRRDRPASRIVAWAVRNGRGPFRLEPPLVLHEDHGGSTPEAAMLHAAVPGAPDQG